MGVLIGRQAPDFTASAVKGEKIIENFKLSDFNDKYKLLLFYPLDFTFVCPTELHAFNDRLEDFKQRDVEVIAISVDSQFSHLAWLKTPKEKGGIEGVAYTLVSDINKTISRDYDVLVQGQGISYRGLFLIDKEGIVRHQVINDLPLGRSVDEALRMIDALQYSEINGEVCPANWQAGEKAMKPEQESLENYFSTSSV